ncbi:MAG: ornithine cyclodeaminase family protein [Chloroflexota bacterium]|nr:ornithine cyclodeaminase family protein [Chloroflexota bacterium]MDE3193076.1 ornithine cyclodeaminase family protein [Chloroflexota bacterium]
MTLLLSNEDVDRLLSMRECIDALAIAYRDLASGRGTDRRRSDSFVAGPVEGSLYSLKSMDGIAPAFGVGAVRIDSDVVTWPTRAGNARREKLAAAGGRFVGLVLLFSIATGEPLAIFPDGYLQRLRVGATNGLAADRLARRDARIVGLLGSGWQAGGQVMALCSVRRVERIRCYSTSREHREAFAAEWSERLGVAVEPVASPEAAVRGADVVLCATNTIDHVFFERWVEPGMHLSSIKRPEIEPAAIERADVIVIHARDASPIHVVAAGVDVPEAREGKGWKLLGEIDFTTLPQLHDVVAGTVPGRTRDDQVTCFLNNIGRGYQFAAAGGALYRKAKAAGAGRELPTEWFTQDVHP